MASDSVKLVMLKSTYQPKLSLIAAYPTTATETEPTIKVSHLNDC
jgi:hypothetical protein